MVTLHPLLQHNLNAALAFLEPSHTTFGMFRKTLLFYMLGR